MGTAPYFSSYFKLYLIPRVAPSLFSPAIQTIQRCGQPGQQQGRRFPSTSSLLVLSIRWLRVSRFLASSIQQIHSLRASGVMFSHAACALKEDIRAFFKSAGTGWTMPSASLLGDIWTNLSHFDGFVYLIYVVAL